MLHNYLAAALRNLLRNGAYAIINILGLTLGFAAAILIALFVRDEYSYDRFIPDHDRIYKVKEVVSPPGEAPLRITVVNSSIAGALKLDYPQIQDVTRLSGEQVALRHGAIDNMAWMFWADSNFFDFFPFVFMSPMPPTSRCNCVSGIRLYWYASAIGFPANTA